MLSDEGSRVFFNAFDALVPADVNGVQDVYQWEAPGSGDCAAGSPAYSELNEGCISLISTGKSAKESVFIDASASGGDVFFTTSSSIDPRDPGSIDVYDARAGGGFPPPPPPPPPCVGDACQNVPAPPDDQTPASAVFRGPGDPVAGGRKCPKGKRRVAERQSQRALREEAKAPRPQQIEPRREDQPMKRLITATAILMTAALWLSAPAQAEFGVKQFDAKFLNQDGTPATQAGSHPFSVNIFLEVNHHEEESRLFVDGGDLKDVILGGVTGLIGDIAAAPRCTTLEFASSACPDETAIGAIGVLFGGTADERFARPAAVYSLKPPPGVPFRLGFIVLGAPIVGDVNLSQDPPYNLISSQTNILQTLTLFGAAAQIWGVPSDPAHDFARGKCLASAAPSDPTEVVVGEELVLEEGGPTCPSEADKKPLLTLPRACEGPLASTYEVDPWNEPGTWVRGSVLTHDNATPPNPIGFDGCGKL